MVNLGLTQIIVQLRYLLIKCHNQTSLISSFLRFWYDLGSDTNIKFSIDQLDEIRKATMARIICDNTKGISEIQTSAFEVSNQVVSCQDTTQIPKLDISKFQGLS